MEVKYPPRSLYHSLTHFREITSCDYQVLKEEGFSDEQICGQLKKPGSKFFSEFASSPHDVVSILQREFPASFANAMCDDDNRVRLSFEFDQPIGVCNLISIKDLTPQEYQTISSVDRDGYIVRKAKSERVFQTSLCQLVLERDYEESCYCVCTLFPGMMAPPLPRRGESDPFWDNHIFIE